MTYNLLIVRHLASRGLYCISDDRGWIYRNHGNYDDNADKLHINCTTVIQHGAFRRRIYDNVAYNDATRNVTIAHTAVTFVAMTFTPGVT